LSDSRPTSSPEPSKAEENPENLRGIAALRHRDFLLFVIGKAMSTASVHMVIVAIMYQVYDMTSDPLTLAYIPLAVVAPAFVFVLFTGYVADIFDRRVVLALCYFTMGIAAALLVSYSASDTEAVWPVYLIMLVLGTGRAFYSAAGSAFVPNLVPRAIFPNAVAWNNSAGKTAQTVGPASMGLLYEISPETVYGTATCVLAASAILTYFIRTRVVRSGREPMSLKTVLAGLVYVWDKQLILGSITLDLFVVLSGGVTALIPIYARDILEIGARGAGFLRAAIAVGGIMAALCLTRISMTRSVGTILFVVTLIFGAMTIVFSLSTSYALSLAAAAIMGASDMVSVYIRSTLLQIATPDEMRGRVSAVNSIFVASSNEIGEFRAGAFAAWIGAVNAGLVGGVAAMFITLICWKKFPELARVQRMDRELT
jgi:MFS family permease